MAKWRKSLKNIPRDGSRVLAYTEAGEYPSIMYWGYVGRFTSSPKMWIGHEFGAVEDRDILGWQPLPDTHK